MGQLSISSLEAPPAPGVTTRSKWSYGLELSLVFYLFINLKDIFLVLFAQSSSLPVCWTGSAGYLWGTIEDYITSDTLVVATEQTSQSDPV